MDDPSNTEYQALVEAERILDEVTIEIRTGDAAALEGLSARDVENAFRHDWSNYHECLEHVRARSSSVRTTETAAMILRARVMRAIAAAVAQPRDT